MLPGQGQRQAGGQVPNYGAAILSQLTGAMQKYGPVWPELLTLQAKPGAWILV